MVEHHNDLEAEGKVRRTHGLNHVIFRFLPGFFRGYSGCNFVVHGPHWTQEFPTCFPLVCVILLAMQRVWRIATSCVDIEELSSLQQIFWVLERVAAFPCINILFSFAFSLFPSYREVATVELVSSHNLSLPEAFAGEGSQWELIIMISDFWDTVSTSLPNLVPVLSLRRFWFAFSDLFTFKNVENVSLFLFTCLILTVFHLFS